MHNRKGPQVKPAGLFAFGVCCLEWQVIVPASCWCAWGGCLLWGWRLLLHWLLVLWRWLLKTLLRVSALRLEAALRLLIPHVLALCERGDAPSAQPVEKDNATLGVRPFPALEVKVYHYLLANLELVYQRCPVVCQLEQDVF